MATLYKGAGPGSYWCTADARQTGFVCPTGVEASPTAAIRHITEVSHPSPFVSFSASYAVALVYASSGPDGPATPDHPGCIWEIDSAKVKPGDIHDPVLEIVQSNGPLGSSILATHHDGGQNLLRAIASKSKSILATPPKRPGPMSDAFPPAVTPQLRAVVYALRDAEVLIERAPGNCIVRRIAVVSS